VGGGVRLESELIPPAVGIRGNPREILRKHLLTSTAIQTAAPLFFGDDIHDVLTLMLFAR